ncbi:hypothetical protein AYI69_g1388 [Smittium culicis]|uniref:NTF2 domain-containing protein n=1 Tax=Smittium culicis TaxID=133412 RepID=A0A1R1YQD8_9FUNG|nr:hypothetical protein AYI69_g1388 [Smittium culicis]
MNYNYPYIKHETFIIGKGMNKSLFQETILDKLPGTRFDVRSHDCQPFDTTDIMNGMVLVVSGKMSNGDLEKQSFSQTLILQKKPEKLNELCIQEDCFRYV